MMTNELREAADRYRRGIEGGAYKDNSYGWNQRDDDAYNLADAFLAEHPEDEDRDFNCMEGFEWACRSGFSKTEFDDNGFGVVIGPLQIWSDWQHVFAGYLGTKTAAKIKTRGDVRRLCKALGIELKEGK